MGLSNLALFAVEALLIAALLIGLFRLRRRLGISLLYIALGVLQYLQTLLALSIYVEMLPGVWASPGSAVFFTANLFSVLLVYIHEDAREARRLIYGLLAANITVSLLSWIVGFHFELPGLRNTLGLPRELFVGDAWTLAIGTLVLWLDVILIIVVFEALARWLRRAVFLRIYCAMSGVLTLDTLLFVTLSFADHAEYSRILFSGIVGKLVVALIYAVVLTIYLRAGEPAARDAVIPALEPRDLLSLLTYREKFEALRAQATRDALTQAYNRGFFEEMLPRELALARRDGVPVGLLAIDVDHFKRINDQRGHSAGDAVLGGLAATLASAVRGTDLVCRYGGDEFVIILRGTDTAQAAAVAEKIRALLAHAPLLPDGGSARTVTVTIGAAAFPADADGARELFEAADRRLLRAKLAGRDRVVSEDHTLE